MSIDGIQLSFLKLRDESALSGGNVVMRNKGGGASKSYGKGTFCLFAIMICINKSAPDKHISVHTFKSTGLPYLINEVLDILPLPQNTNTLGWITNENFYFIFYFLSL